ncbi:hypothetical protein RQP46_002733 [Phenoliferia psychrophenolica]
MRWKWPLAVALLAGQAAAAGQRVGRQLVGGQFLTAGLIILNSPQPGTTVQVGQKLSLSLDVSGDGLLPSPNPNVATTLLNLNIFLVSATNNINFSISQGPDLLSGEKGSTVKHADVDLPDCLPEGSYNLTFYELSQINSSPFFTIDSIPLTLSRSSSLSEDPSSTCGGSTPPESQPQVDSRSPIQPFSGHGQAAFVLSTGAKLNFIHLFLNLIGNATRGDERNVEYDYGRQRWHSDNNIK